MYGARLCPATPRMSAREDQAAVGGGQWPTLRAEPEHHWVASLGSPLHPGVLPVGRFPPSPLVPSPDEGGAAWKGSATCHWLCACQAPMHKRDWGRRNPGGEVRTVPSLWLQRGPPCSPGQQVTVDPCRSLSCVLPHKSRSACPGHPLASTY